MLATDAESSHDSHPHCSWTDSIFREFRYPIMLGNLEHALHSFGGICVSISTASSALRRRFLGTFLHIWINNVQANKISERKWWLSLITNLKQQRTVLSNTFISYKTIYHTQYRPDEKEGGSNQDRMPITSLLVIAHCNWKLPLSGSVCSGNYNKPSAWHVVCTDVVH